MKDKYIHFIFETEITKDGFSALKLHDIILSDGNFISSDHYNCFDPFEIFEDIQQSKETGVLKKKWYSIIEKASFSDRCLFNKKRSCFFKELSGLSFFSNFEFNFKSGKSIIDSWKSSVLKNSDDTLDRLSEHVNDNKKFRLTKSDNR